MAKKIIAAKQQNRSKADSKAIAEAASRAAGDAMPYLWALRDLGENLRTIPICGWSMSICLAAVVEETRRHIELMPIPSDRKLATHIRKLISEAHTAIDEIEGAALLMGNEDYDDGLCEHKEAAAVGIGIKSLAEKSVKTVDLAACLLDPEYVAGICDHQEMVDERAKFGLAAAA